MSIELWKELIELDGHIAATNPSLYERLKPGLPRTQSQKLQQEIGWFLPNEIIDLYTWKNGTDASDADDGCTHWQLKPGGAFIPLELSLHNLAESSMNNHMKNLYVEYGYLHIDDEVNFAPLMVTSEWQWGRELDYVTLVPVTRQQRDTLPLINFDSGADAGLPGLSYDSLLSMVQVINQLHRAQILRLTPIGHLYIEGVHRDVFSRIHTQLNPQCEAIDICETEKYYGESRWSLSSSS